MTTTSIPGIGLERSPTAGDDSVPEVHCTLGEAERGRRAESLRSGLLGHLVDVVPIGDPATGREGARLRFDGAGAALAREIDEFVAFESRCCGFASFQTGVEQDAVPSGGGDEMSGGKRSGDGRDALWLDISGPPGTQDFLARWVPGASAAFGAARGAACAALARDTTASIPKSLGLAGLGLLMCCLAPILGALGFAALAASAGAWFEGASVVLLAAAAYTWWRGHRAAQAPPGASSALPVPGDGPRAADPTARSGGEGCGC